MEENMKKLLFVFVLVLSFTFILVSTLCATNEIPDNVEIVKNDSGEYVVTVSPDGTVKKTTDLSNIDKTLEGKEIETTTTPATGDVETTASIEKEYSVYSEKDEKSAIITKIKSGKSMVFLERDGEWVKVATEEGIGYMKVNDLITLLGVQTIGNDDKKDTNEVSLNDTEEVDLTNKDSDEVDLTNNDNNSDESTPPTDEATEDKPKGIPATITYDKSVHVRLEKALESDEQLIIEPGATVNLLSIEDEWCKIEYDGKTGYVRSFYLGVSE
jgi:SH3-like domain-containing protein